MSNFPLYDSLVNGIPKKDLTVKQKEEFITKIKNIDSTGRDLVYALIQFYRIENDGGSACSGIPYKGKREEDDKVSNISWSLTNFPTKLRHVLYKFVNLHMKNMEEEEVRQTHVI